MADQQKQPGKKKKDEKKKVKLRDLPKNEGELTEEQARNVKGGDEPPPDPFPTKTTGS